MERDVIKCSGCLMRLSIVRSQTKACGLHIRVSDAPAPRFANRRADGGKNSMKLALGIVTSIGGFLDVGAIATAALAGAAFGLQMLWVLALGTLCVIFLTEMAGRLACVSHHSLVDAVRERCGFRYFSFLLIGELLVDLLVLAAEIGGVAVALHLVTGIDYRWFVPFVAFALWLLIWLGTFSIVQNGVSLLGLITLAFVVGMW